jgi:hypothetical protein
MNQNIKVYIIQIFSDLKGWRRPLVGWLLKNKNKMRILIVNNSSNQRLSLDEFLSWKLNSSAKSENATVKKFIEKGARIWFGSDFFSRYFDFVFYEKSIQEGKSAWFPSEKSEKQFLIIAKGRALLQNRTCQPADLERGLAEIEQVQSLVNNKSALSLPAKAVNRWNLIGGYDRVKLLLEQSVVWFYKKKQLLDDFGISPSRGAILYGPPGCGKTLLAQSVAQESGATFMAIQISQLVKSLVGESEKAIANLFRKAKELGSPCLLFLDEIDAMFSSSGGDLKMKMCSQIISELDGLESKDQIVVLCATNYIEGVDSSLLRSGRIDRRILVGPPTFQDRLEIISLLLSNLKIAKSIDIDVTFLAKESEGFTGSTLNECIRRACLSAVAQSHEEPCLTSHDIFLTMKLFSPPASL